MGDGWCLGVSGGCLGGSGECLGAAGGVWRCWVVSGGCFRHFFRSGHFVPPPGHTGIQDPGPDRIKRIKDQHTKLSIFNSYIQ